MPSNDDDTFEKAYGAFMLAWADIENELYHALCAYAKTDDSIARAIFSGARARQMMDFIKAIAHNTGLAGDRKKDLDYVFPQILHINSVRDALAHYATPSHAFDPNDRGLRAWSNGRRVSRYGNEQIVAVKPETLQAMTLDLYLIGHYLNMHWGKRPEGFRSWGANPANPGCDWPPWLYVPPTAQLSGRKPQLGLPAPIKE